MIYKIKQVYNIFFPKLKDEDLELIEINLEEAERKIFDEMHPYDKKHSINVLKGVLKNVFLKNDMLYRRLALLHDCGKDSSTTFMTRVKYSLFKIGRIHYHPSRGYEKLREIDYKLALLIQKHHNRNIDNIKLKAFQKIDNKN